MCLSRRLSFLILLCLALRCSAESDEELDFEAEEEDSSKNLNSNGCTSREQYFACPGAPTCQRTCSNLNGACVTDGNCVPGCYCRSGFARDVFTNECIPIKQCPGTSCPRNEFFNTCESRTECERTCAERNIPCDPAIPCNTLCQCKSGFFRDPVSKSCVRERDCSTPSSDPPRCPRNEHFESCGSGCKETCPGNQNCALECISGCFCDAGLVRIKGRCVEASKCTKNCPTGERPDCIWPCSESCDPNACDGVTDTICRGQCVCLPGAKRNPEGKCVPKDDCPLICPENEVEGFLDRCMDSCFNDQCKLDPPQSITPVRQCVCKTDFKRDESQVCIHKDSCPQCREGEEWAVSDECLERCDTLPCIFGEHSAVERCTCKNYRRRQIQATGYGKCVGYSTCQCLDPNARHGYLSQCFNDCSFTKEQCEDGNNDDRIYSCFCKDFYRLINGTCQPMENCPNP